MPNDIEALVPAECPHCHKEVVLKLKVAPPEIIEVTTPDAVADVIAKLTNENQHDITKGNQTE